MEVGIVSDRLSFQRSLDVEVWMLESKFENPVIEFRVEGYGEDFGMIIRRGFVRRGTDTFIQRRVSKGFGFRGHDLGITLQ